MKDKIKELPTQQKPKETYLPTTPPKLVLPDEFILTKAGLAAITEVLTASIKNPFLKKATFDCINANLTPVPPKED